MEFIKCIAQEDVPIIRAGEAAFEKEDTVLIPLGNVKMIGGNDDKNSYIFLCTNDGEMYIAVNSRGELASRLIDTAVVNL